MGHKKSKLQPPSPKPTSQLNFGSPPLPVDRLIEVTPNFQYNTSCDGGRPCRHKVVANGRPGEMTGNEVYTFCTKNSIPVPLHFTCYR